MRTDLVVLGALFALVPVGLASAQEATPRIVADVRPLLARDLAVGAGVVLARRRVEPPPVRVPAAPAPRGDLSAFDRLTAQPALLAAAQTPAGDRMDALASAGRSDIQLPQNEIATTLAAGRRRVGRPVASLTIATGTVPERQRMRLGGVIGTVAALAND